MAAVALRRSRVSDGCAVVVKPVVVVGRGVVVVVVVSAQAILLPAILTQAILAQAILVPLVWWYLLSLLWCSW